MTNGKTVVYGRHRNSNTRRTAVSSGGTATTRIPRGVGVYTRTCALCILFGWPFHRKGHLSFCVMDPPVPEARIKNALTNTHILLYTNARTFINMYIYIYINIRRTCIDYTHTHMYILYIYTDIYIYKIYKTVVRPYTQKTHWPYPQDRMFLIAHAYPRTAFLTTPNWTKYVPIG